MLILEEFWYTHRSYLSCYFFHEKFTGRDSIPNTLIDPWPHCRLFGFFVNSSIQVFNCSVHPDGNYSFIQIPFFQSVGDTSPS